MLYRDLWYANWLTDLQPGHIVKTTITSHAPLSISNIFIIVFKGEIAMTSTPASSARRLCYIVVCMHVFELALLFSTLGSIRR